MSYSYLRYYMYVLHSALIIHEGATIKTILHDYLPFNVTVKPLSSKTRVSLLSYNSMRIHDNQTWSPTRRAQRREDREAPPRAHPLDQDLQHRQPGRRERAARNIHARLRRRRGCGMEIRHQGIELLFFCFSCIKYTSAMHHGRV